MPNNYISPISMDALSSLCSELGKNNSIKRSDFEQVNIIITIISIKSIKENELCSTLSLSGKIPTL